LAPGDVASLHFAIMNRRLVVAAAVVAAIGVGAAASALLVQRSRARAADEAARLAASKPTEHGASLDNAMAAALVMYKAPPGATPCESAYNAYKASLDLSDAQHIHPVVLRLAAHDDFIARCGAFPPAVQSCLIPAYLAKNRRQCLTVKPSRDALDALVIVKPPGEWHPGDQEPLPDAAP
jgi:hypothetical protein